MVKLSNKVLGISPSPTLAIDSKAKRMIREGLDVVSFGAGEPDFDTPDYIKDSAITAIKEGFTKYTPVGGIPELKVAVARYMTKSTGAVYESSNVMVSSGAKHCLFNVLYSLVDPGDKVLIPTPYWVSYPELVRLCGGEPVFVKSRDKENFSLKAEDIEPLIENKTKALIINTPNNPTGTVYYKDDLKDIAEIAKKYDLTVISDEIYEKLIYDDLKHTSIVSVDENMYERTVVVNGVSKAYAMTGWRIGFAAGPEKTIKAMTNLQSHSTSNPNSTAQWAALAALTNQSVQECVETMVKEFSRRRDFMTEHINQIPYLSCQKPQGAFYVMVDVSQTFGKKVRGRVIADSADFADLLLEEHKVAVVPGQAFGSRDFVRLSYATSLERIETGLSRMKRFVESIEK